MQPQKYVRGWGGQGERRRALNNILWERHRFNNTASLFFPQYTYDSPRLIGFESFMHDDHQPHYSNQWKNSDKVQLSISGNSTLAQVVTNLWYILSVRLPCLHFYLPFSLIRVSGREKKRGVWLSFFFSSFFWGGGGRLWGTNLIVSSFFLLISMGNLPISDGMFSFFDYNVLTHRPISSTCHVSKVHQRLSYQYTCIQTYADCIDMSSCNHYYLICYSLSAVILPAYFLWKWHSCNQRHVTLYETWETEVLCTACRLVHVREHRSLLTGLNIVRLIQ